MFSNVYHGLNCVSVSRYLSIQFHIMATNIKFGTELIWNIQLEQCGLFVAEDVGVKVVDCIRCNEGGTEDDGPDNQNRYKV